MAEIVDIAERRMRCPRCRATSTILAAFDIRRGFQYLTMRCNACTIVFDAQVARDEGHQVTLSLAKRLPLISVNRLSFRSIPIRGDGLHPFWRRFPGLIVCSLNRRSTHRDRPQHPGQFLRR